jgi:hypothetical protein
MSTRWMILFALTTLALVSRADADEQPNTIHGLYLQCTSTTVVAPVAYCTGYLEGVAASMMAADSVLVAKGLHYNLGWCGDAHVTNEQLIQAFKNWHDKHPQFWDKPKVLGVTAALQETWPCKD